VRQAQTAETRIAKEMEAKESQMKSEVLLKEVMWVMSIFENRSTEIA
jgi:hypothetical protein